RAERLLASRRRDAAEDLATVRRSIAEERPARQRSYAPRSSGLRMDHAEAARRSARAAPPDARKGASIVGAERRECDDDDGAQSADAGPAETATAAVDGRREGETVGHTRMARVGAGRCAGDVLDCSGLFTWTPRLRERPRRGGRIVSNFSLVQCV